jgi:hypothetical protein
MIHGAKNNRISSDPEGQGQDCDRRESGIVSENTRCISQVLARFLECAKRPLLATQFGDACSIAEITSGASAGCLGRQASVREIVDLLLEVGVDLVLEIAIEVPTPQIS